MAEVIVSCILLRLEDPVVQEAFKLYGVKDKVDTVKRGLTWIRIFLKDADSRVKLNDSERIEELNDSQRIEELNDNASIVIWVREVREVSFMIEDSINTFLYKVENLSLNEKEPNFFKKIAKLFTKRPMKYFAMDNLDSARNGILASINEIIDLAKRYWIPDLRSLRKNSMNISEDEDEDDEIDLVGFDKERRSIIKLLLDQNTRRRSVVSIVGIGGSGKTTLAKKIYQSVREKFEFHIWLTISQEFNQINFLKKVLDEAKIKEDLEENFAAKVKGFLTGKRYLIILDDVYSGDVWTQMEDALPNDNNMSRVVIITRNGERMCNEIIVTRYESLPFYLRLCFMYFALFPEYHEYDAKLIACLWIAEEFIPHEHDGLGGMEGVTKTYLEVLAQRCMIKVLRSGDGSILTFRVHKLLHEFAMREAQETCFVKVLSKKDDFANNNRRDVRRVTSQLNDSNWEESSSQENKITENINPNISTLLLFGMMLPFGSQFMMLRVLVIFHYNGGLQDKFPSLLVSTLKKLLLLRCLAFIGCNFPSEVVLPINHLQKLITLIIRSCQNIIVPSDLLSNITTLRHVEINDESIIQLGSGSGDLQTLKGVTIENPGIELLNIPNVRELHLSNQYDSWDPIIALLAKLGKIETLTLEASKIPIKIICTDVFRGFNTLRTLYLNGEWLCNNLGADMFPPFLTSLKLVNSQIDKNLMRVLETLPCLTILSLFGAYKGSEMTTSEGGFPELLKLEISWIYGLKKWIIEEGAMPELTDLKICYCNKLEILPDLQYVTTLEVLTLRYMNKNFKLRLEKEDRHKIDHIPSIIIKRQMNASCYLNLYFPIRSSNLIIRVKFEICVMNIIGFSILRYK